MDEIDYRRIKGTLEYARVGWGIVRWAFDVTIDDTIDTDPDPRVLAFIEWVRERNAALLASSSAPTDVPLT
ncbi:MAG: hypothetical protein IT518_08525 [Burkholderiales bacterium]|nr:hypothetical protein [Burkholderiales bacterium]